MLVLLRKLPKSEAEWQTWAFHHRVSHTGIRQAIRSNYNVNLTEYVLEPIRTENFSTFLEANSQAHSDMNSVLGAQSQDIEDVNLEDERQALAWIYLHFLEHQTAEQKLGIAT